MLPRKFWFPLFAVAMLALPLLPVPEFWITQANYIGSRAWRG
jgi:branched-chain amino acid transport system permease protein